jgi:hypothetical protein
MLVTITGGLATVGPINLVLDQGFDTDVLGLKFVDAGGDDIISSGDYFVYTGTSALTITVIYKSGDTNTPLADGTI